MKVSFGSGFTDWLFSTGDTKAQYNSTLELFQTHVYKPVASTISNWRGKVSLCLNHLKDCGRHLYYLYASSLVYGNLDNAFISALQHNNVSATKTLLNSGKISEDKLKQAIYTAIINKATDVLSLLLSDEKVKQATSNIAMGDDQAQSASNPQYIDADNYVELRFQKKGCYDFDCCFVVAAKNGYQEGVKALREQITDPNTILVGFVLADKHKHKGVAKVILNYIGNNHTSLSYAAKYGHFDVVTDILDKEQNISKESLESVLSYAAKYGHFDVVTDILDKEQNISKESLESALRAAASGGYNDVVKLILSIEKPTPDKPGSITKLITTGIHLFFSQHKPEIISKKALIDAFSQALENRHIAVLRCISDIDTFSQALENRHIAVLRCISDHDKNIPNEWYKKNKSRISKITGDRDLLFYFQSHGINIPKEKLVEAFKTAAKLEKTDVLRHILSLGIISEEDLVEALKTAVRNKLESSVEILLESQIMISHEKLLEVFESAITNKNDRVIDLLSSKLTPISDDTLGKIITDADLNKTIETQLANWNFLGFFNIFAPEIRLANITDDPYLLYIANQRKTMGTDWTPISLKEMPIDPLKCSECLKEKIDSLTITLDDYKIYSALLPFLYTHQANRYKLKLDLEKKRFSSKLTESLENKLIFPNLQILANFSGIRGKFGDASLEGLPKGIAQLKIADSIKDLNTLNDDFKREFNEAFIKAADLSILEGEQTIKKIRDGKFVTIQVGYNEKLGGHAVNIIFYKNHLVICNKGSRLPFTPIIQHYQYNKDCLKPELFQFLIINYLKERTDNTGEIHQHIYLYTALPKILQATKVDSISPIRFKEQKIGNCTKASAMAAFKMGLYLKLLDGGLSSEVAAKEVKKSGDELSILLRTKAIQNVQNLLAEANPEKLRRDETIQILNLINQAEKKCVPPTTIQKIKRVILDFFEML